MRRVLQYALPIVLAIPLSLSAQMRSSAPPASIYSLGGSTLGPPPASIYSIPSRSTFCCNGNFGFGRGSVGQFNAGGRGFNNGGRGRNFRRHHLGSMSGAFYLPYAVSPYYEDYPPDVEPSQGMEARREMDSSYPAAPTIFENRPGAPYRPEDSRYGTHYLDSRELNSRELNSRDNDRRTPTEDDRAADAATVAEIIPTVLVFRDGRQQEITNYAIMGKTLFVLSGERSKIPVSELDLDATIAANDKRGIDFRVPKN